MHPVDAAPRAHRVASELLHLLRDLAPWLRAHGGPLTRALRRPWSGEALGWLDTLRTLHDELLARYAALAAALTAVPSSDAAWRAVHEVIEARRALDAVELTWSLTLHEAVPWFAPLPVLERSLGVEAPRSCAPLA